MSTNAAPSPSTPINSVDPYAITLEPGESVIREGYAVRDVGGRCFDAVGEYTADMRTASLFPCPRAASKERHHYVSGEIVHITIIRSPERRELVDLGDDVRWVCMPQGWEARLAAMDGGWTLHDAPGGNWRPIRIIPGTERAVVRRLVPGPTIEG